MPRSQSVKVAANTWIQLLRAPVRARPEAAALAERYPSPSNSRELENRIGQAVILCDGEQIGPGDLRSTSGSPDS